MNEQIRWQLKLNAWRTNEELSVDSHVIVQCKNVQYKSSVDIILSQCLNHFYTVYHLYLTSKVTRYSNLSFSSSSPPEQPRTILH